MRYVIQKLDRDVKSIMLKFSSDQTISLRILHEKQGNADSGIHSKLLKCFFSYCCNPG